MSKILAVKGDRERGNEVIALLEMLGGDNRWKASGNIEKVYYSISNGAILYSPQIEKGTVIYTLDEFYKNFPFKVGDKIFLYDNITEGCVTGMEWDENKGTVKYCVYTSAEYWCDVKELLKWNPIDFLEDIKIVNEIKPLFKAGDVVKLKGCPDKNLFWIVMDVVKDGYIFNDGEKCSFDDQHHYEKTNREVINTQPPKMKNVLAELLEHIKNTPKEELEQEFNELEEWSHVGPTVEEFMTFCECVNKKPKYPDNYDECVRIAKNIHGYDIHIDAPAYGEIMESFVKLLICRDAYWKIYGEQMGLDEPWKHNYLKGANTIRYAIYNTGDEIVKLDGKLYRNYILCFPSEEMRDVFHENFKDLIEQCKELL